MSSEEIAGRYRLIEPLGRGAMSSVWLAEDRELERRVAVKLLSGSADRARFEREARAAASLSHPNLCALYAYGESAGTPYMVLEYLPNGSLEDLLKAKGPLADDDTVRIATEIAAGLAHAHGRGLVHRDLKPANVLFDGEGRAKIADFGIARIDAGGTLTEVGTVLGTASYISPEQAGGLPAGPPSDVYSFGVILFRMLTGRLPFTGANAMDVVRMHRDDPPPHVTDFRADAPAALVALATAALAKDPAVRPQDGAALLGDLRSGGEARTMILAPRAVVPDAATQATRLLRLPPPASRRRRRSTAVLLGLIALAVLGAGAAVLITRLSSGGGSAPPIVSLPTVSLPTVAALSTTSSATTTAPITSSAATTTRPATTTNLATTTATTTAQATTTAAALTTTATASTDTVPTTTSPITTTVPATTTGPTTTEPVTTDTGATTTTATPAP